MEIAILSCVAVSLALLIVCVVLIILLLKNNKKDISNDEMQVLFDEAQDNIIETLIDKNEESRKSIIENSQTVSRTIASTIEPYMNTFDNKLNNLTQENKSSLDDMRRHVGDSIEKLRESNVKSMQDIQNSNDKKLDEMRKTVDEKLSSTLDERITNAFKMINENLSQLQIRFGEMTKLSEQVGNLNKVFTNVKTRGGWGEVSLASLLDQILAPEQYVTQWQVSGHSLDRVDFAIKMPGASGKDFVYLPIDSKFPTSDYERLVDASERGSQADAISARDALIRRIKEEAKSISSKYIKPPKTTDFAVMYLPTEGLYAEIVKNPELCNELQNKYKIIICGPTVIAALLNSLQVGFTTLKIQRNSGEVVKLMKNFQKDFATFTEMISKVRKNAESMVESINKLDTKNNSIIKRLNKVEEIDYGYNDTLQLIEGKEIGNEEE